MIPLSKFDQFSSHYRPLIEAELLSYATFHLRDPRKVLEEAMQYCLLAPAKRIRPLMTLATFFMFSQDYKKIMPCAAAIEMVHTYSLIHDDLPAMDNDDFRRGQQTCHKKFREDIAILAGDTLNTLAFEVMAKHSTAYSADKVLSAIVLLATSCGINGMAGGQVLDLYGSETKNEAALKHIHALKTGAMIQASVMIPVILEEADDKTAQALEVFATHLGLLFQIVDDILDVVGDQAVVGKTIGKDFDQNKLTYVHFFGLEKAKQLALEESEKAKMALSSINNYDTSLLLGLLDYIGTRNL